jgi:hypothetical protein
MSVAFEDRLQVAIVMATEAKAKADLAEQRVTGHEELCAERYENIKQSISDVRNIIKWAGATLTVSILSVLGVLIAQLWTDQADRLAKLEATTSHQTPASVKSLTD